MAELPETSMAMVVARRLAEWANREERIYNEYYHKYKTNRAAFPPRPTLYAPLDRALHDIWCAPAEVSDKNKAAKALRAAAEEASLFSLGEYGDGSPVFGRDLLKFSLVSYPSRDTEIRKMLLPKLNAFCQTLPAKTYERPRDPEAKATAQAAYERRVAALKTALEAVNEELSDPEKDKDALTEEEAHHACRKDYPLKWG
jgi:hypothetical protein